MLAEGHGAPVSVLLADDHHLLRQGLRGLLSEFSSLRVVGDAANADEAVERACALRPDVVLMDLSMPGGGGIAATRELRTAVPDVAVIILSVSDHAADLLGALRAGARGYVLKTDEVDEVVRAIESVAAGQAALAPEMATKLLDHLHAGDALLSPDTVGEVGLAALSERERGVLRLLVDGASNRRIAGELCLSENTVRTHLVNILDKLGLENRVQAATFALRSGLAS